jgi:SAM-dependent methyltransferase
MTDRASAMPRGRSPSEDECSAVYDAVFADHEDSGFYRWAAEHYGGPILEVGCGTGRILLSTALAGFSILGIDPNASRIKVCREAIAMASIDRSIPVDAVVGDVRTFESNRRFRLVTSPFRSLQHLLTPDDQFQALKNVLRLLEPGGHFIIDVFNPCVRLLANDSLRSEFSSGHAAALPDGRTVELLNRIVDRDYVKQLQHAEEIYVFTSPDGIQHRVALEYTTRYTFRYEFEYLAALCGYDIVEVYGSYDRLPFGTTYPGEILMILRKPV